MKVNFGKLRRLGYGALALAVVGATTVPALSGTASAAQVTSRYVKMSSSANAAGAVTYEVGFTLAQAHSGLQGIVIDFCEETPIINDTTCTIPGTTGFSVGAPSATVSGSFTTAGSWTFGSLNGGRTFYADNTTANNVSASTAGTVTITTMTNPDTVNTSFYARIYTYTTTGHAAQYTVANPAAGGAVRDSGGVAMSTAAQITVTAKVQETLTFCVYTDVNCAAGGTAVTLGDNNGVLRTSGAFVDKNTKYDIATNASGSAIVRLKTPATLTSGGNTIAGTGAAGATSTPGSSQFGLCSYVASGGNLSITAPYNDTTDCAGTTQTAGTGSTGGDNGATFALDLTTGGENLTTTYGDPLATATAGNSSTGQVAFLGNVSPTQAAGIYTSTFTFIATGTY